MNTIDNHLDDYAKPREARRDSVRDPLRWRLLGLRLWRTLVLAAAYFVLELVAKVVVILQFILIAAGVGPSAWLCRRGCEMADFMHHMWLYMSCERAQAPWPFERWPWADPELRPVIDGEDDGSSARKPD